MRKKEICHIQHCLEATPVTSRFVMIVKVETLDNVLAQFTNDLGEVGIALFTFLYVDFLDTSVGAEISFGSDF